MARSTTPTPELGGGAGEFATTRWSLVVRTASCDSGQASVALEQLCELYWEPVYVFLRRRGYSPDDAADYTQGFFARLLEKRDIAPADRERLRFRSYVLGALKHYVANQISKACALKRGGGFALPGPGVGHAEARYCREPATMRTPESEFARKWALDVLAKARQRLQARYEAEGKAVLFAELSQHLARDADAAPYAESAQRLAMSVNAVKVAMHRLRHRYRDEIRKLVADTVADAAEVDDEIRFLMQALES